MSFYQSKAHFETDASSALPIPRWRWWMVRSLRLFSVLTLAAAVAQLLLIRIAGDWWWFGTVVLFAPRWPLLIPVGALAAASAVLDWRSLAMNLLAGAIIAWPLMGWHAPSPWGAQPAGAGLRVMSINMGGGASLELLRDRIDLERPDVVVVQEITPDLLPKIFDETWHVFSDGGLCVASQFSILRTDALPGQPPNRWSSPAAAAEIQTERGNAWIIGVHLETPRWGFEGLKLNRSGLHGGDGVKEGIERRRQESEQVLKWIAGHEGPKIIAGDFNMPTESRIYQRYWSGWTNSFSSVGAGYGFTKFTEWHGVRIDHILCNWGWRVNSVGVGASVGGDHCPVIADLSQRTATGSLEGETIGAE